MTGNGNSKKNTTKEKLHRQLSGWSTRATLFFNSERIMMTQDSSS